MFWFTVETVMIGLSTEGIRNGFMIEEVARGVASGSSCGCNVGVGQSSASDRGENVKFGVCKGGGGGAPIPDCSSRSLNANEIVLTTFNGSDSQ